jgi:hypothetical protein
MPGRPKGFSDPKIVFKGLTETLKFYRKGSPKRSLQYAQLKLVL